MASAAVTANLLGIGRGHGLLSRGLLVHSPQVTVVPASPKGATISGRSGSLLYDHRGPESQSVPSPAPSSPSTQREVFSFVAGAASPTDGRKDLLPGLQSGPGKALRAPAPLAIKTQPQSVQHNCALSPVSPRAFQASPGVSVTPDFAAADAEPAARMQHSPHVTWTIPTVVNSAPAAQGLSELQSGATFTVHPRSQNVFCGVRGQASRFAPLLERVGGGPRKVVRRMVTNSRERWRQQNVNSAYNELRGILPTHPVDKKLSKNEILRLTIRYIQFLMDLLDEQRAGAEADPAAVSTGGQMDLELESPPSPAGIGKEERVVGGTPAGVTSSVHGAQPVCRQTPRSRGSRSSSDSGLGDTESLCGSAGSGCDSHGSAYYSDDNVGSVDSMAWFSPGSNQSM